MRPQAQGFTLIELLVTLGLLATLTALIAPALLSAGQGVSLTAHAKDLQSLLNGGRSLAMIHQQSVFVCGASPVSADASLTPEPCDAHGEWRHGIHVVLDRNSNQAPDVDDAIQLFRPPTLNAPRWTGKAFAANTTSNFSLRAPQTGKTVVSRFVQRAKSPKAWKSF